MRRGTPNKGHMHVRRNARATSSSRPPPFSPTHCGGGTGTALCDSEKANLAAVDEHGRQRGEIRHTVCVLAEHRCNGRREEGDGMHCNAHEKRCRHLTRRREGSRNTEQGGEGSLYLPIRNYIVKGKGYGLQRYWHSAFVGPRVQCHWREDNEKLCAWADWDCRGERPRGAAPVGWRAAQSRRAAAPCAGPSHGAARWGRVGGRPYTCPPGGVGRVAKSGGVKRGHGKRASTNHGEVHIHR